MAYLSTIAAFGFGDFNPPTLLPLYRKLGCLAGQFYRNPNNAPPPAQARRIAEDAGLPFDSMHGLFGPGYDPSSPDEAVRRAAIETYKAEADIALQIGGPRVIVHPAAPVAETDQKPTAGRAQRLTSLQRSLEELAEIGQRVGVTFLIENIPDNYYLGADVAGLAAMIRELDHPNVRMCFDTGHAHMTADAAQVIAEVRDVVGYLHVHDNDGVHDSHEIPGVVGDFPWDPFAPGAALLPAQTPAMLELFISEAALQQQIDAGLYTRLKHWLALDASK